MSRHNIVQWMIGSTSYILISFEIRFLRNLDKMSKRNDTLNLCDDNCRTYRYKRNKSNGP